VIKLDNVALHATCYLARAAPAPRGPASFGWPPLRAASRRGGRRRQQTSRLQRCPFYTLIKIVANGHHSNSKSLSHANNPAHFKN